MLSALSRLILCDLKDCSPPGSSVLGISEARILEYSWSVLELSCPSPVNLPDPGIEPTSLTSVLARRFFTTAAAASKSLQSRPTLRDPMDCSPPGSSVHGMLQARVLEWGAIAF